MRTALATALALILLTACEKSSSPPQEVATPKPDPAAPSASAAPAATAAAATTTAAAAASSAAPSTASSAALAAANSAASASAPAKASAPSAAPPASGASAGALKPASKHVSGKNFALDLASPGCKAGTECVVTIKLVTQGDFHVNKEYPYKFVATAAPNLTFLGKSDANTFTRANGDFVEQGEKAGVMTIRFKPAAAGDAQVAGTYKFSVCSAEQCQIEQEKLDLTVSIM